MPTVPETVSPIIPETFNKTVLFKYSSAFWRHSRDTQAASDLGNKILGSFFGGKG